MPIDRKEGVEVYGDGGISHVDQTIQAKKVGKKPFGLCVLHVVCRDIRYLWFMLQLMTNKCATGARVY